MNLIKDNILLQTERLFLSRWAPDDAGLIQQLHGVAETTHFIGDGRVWTLAMAEERLADWNHDFQRDGISKMKLSSLEDGRFIGRAGFTFYKLGGFFELGYSIRREEWGKGYATEIATALSGWLFENRGASQFMAFAEDGNLASIEVLKRIGMTETTMSGMNGPDHRLFRMRAPAPV